MVKYTNKSNLMEKGVYFSSQFWATYSQSIVVEKPKQQEHEAAIHTHSQEQGENECMHTCTQPPSPLLHSSEASTKGMVTPTVGLPQLVWSRHSRTDCPVANRATFSRQSQVEALFWIASSQLLKEITTQAKSGRTFSPMIGPKKEFCTCDSTRMPCGCPECCWLTASWVFSVYSSELWNRPYRMTSLEHVQPTNASVCTGPVGC